MAVLGFGQWEALIARARFFRTRRESFPVAHPTMAVGDIGSASGALGMLVARDAVLRGYAPARVALCDAASDGGLRPTAVLGAAF